jgi:predicted nucleic acid-binding protein
VYLLDTDTLSNILRGHEQTTSRFRSEADGTVFTSSVTLYQILSGNISQIKALSDPNLKPTHRPESSLAIASTRFIELIHDLTLFDALAYTDDDHDLFLSFKASVKRVGSQDCMIAAMAIRRGYTVATCNRKDFFQIPNVVFEDWSL